MSYIKPAKVKIVKIYHLGDGTGLLIDKNRNEIIIKKCRAYTKEMLRDIDLTKYDISDAEVISKLWS